MLAAHEIENPPAPFTTLEVRRWLAQLGVTGAKLPKVGRVLIVEQPGRWGGLWRVERHAAGFYLISTVR